MNEADQLLRLFAYDSWACLNILKMLDVQEPFALQEEATAMFAHIVASQVQWYSRITNDPVKKIDLWPPGNLPQSRKQLMSMSDKWTALIDANEGRLDRYIEYQNSKGDSYQNMLSDILHHVIIHGQHHRAQIASMLRRSDITPPPTDYIFYLRQTKT